MLSAAISLLNTVISLIATCRALCCTICTRSGNMLISSKKIIRFAHKSTFFIAVLLSLFHPTNAQQKNLDYFLEQAIQNSPLLKETNNNILLNRIDSLRIRATYKPQVNGIINNYYAPFIN